MVEAPSQIVQPGKRLAKKSFLIGLLLALRVNHGDAIKVAGNEHWKRFATVAAVTKEWKGQNLLFLPNMLGQYRDWDDTLLNASHQSRLLYTKSTDPRVLSWDVDADFAIRMLTEMHAESMESLLMLADVYDKSIV